MPCGDTEGVVAGGVQLAPGAAAGGLVAGEEAGAVQPRPHHPVRHDAHAGAALAAAPGCPAAAMVVSLDLPWEPSSIMLTADDDPRSAVVW